jgi:O-antigen ligase
VLRVTAAILAVWFLAQGVLTFSRGGSLNLAIALVVAIPFFLRTAQMAVRFFAVSLVVGAVIVFGMIPIIQNITGGHFGERFTSSNSTLRTDLMQIELEAWADNPVLGIGVGMMERTVEDEGAAERGELPKLPAHTEYTRLLAEHGILGLAAIITLVGLAIRSVRSQPLPIGRIFAVVFVAWCASEVAHSATRLALVPLLFGLAALRIEPDAVLEPEGPRPPEHRRRDVPTAVAAQGPGGSPEELLEVAEETGDGQAVDPEGPAPGL